MLEFYDCLGWYVICVIWYDVSSRPHEDSFEKFFTDSLYQINESQLKTIKASEKSVFFCKKNPIKDKIYFTFYIVSKKNLVLTFDWLLKLITN